MTINDAIKKHKKLKIRAEETNDKRGVFYSAEEHKQLAEWLEELKAIKDNCNGKCTNCINTELPNINDCKEIDIGYSYAYKTDCAGDRYIKAEEVKYLLKSERNKSLDDFVNACKGNTLCQTFGLRQCDIDKIAEQLKAGGKE